MRPEFRIQVSVFFMAVDSAGLSDGAEYNKSLISI